MYDWELSRYLKDRDYNLSNIEYTYVCNTCPQINHIKYDAWSNMFEMWSENGRYFKFKVYHKE